MTCIHFLQESIETIYLLLDISYTLIVNYDYCNTVLSLFSTQLCTPPGAFLFTQFTQDILFWK